MNPYNHPSQLIPDVENLGYILEEELATVLYLMLQLEKPLLLEGNPGVGKTQAAYIIADLLGLELVRLQCYEGLDVHNAIYEWNYQRQLLSIKVLEQSQKSEAEKEATLFDEKYLLKRPLLQAITGSKKKVLLIDEIDRADEEFEAFLLELLSDFQLSIPELGTIKAEEKPIVILTSNRTRELSDALRRRSLYHWVEYPSPEKEKKILNTHVPDLDQEISNKIVEYVEKMRNLKLDKLPGVAETIDWARGIQLLGNSEDNFEQSLSCLLKSERDISKVKQELF